ncbi:MAG: hypothetical protein KDA58_12900, partial [Planctomycetaceae bacterium]|nr:hypothetical protein [Planctomycetaceae bacterium]
GNQPLSTNRTGERRVNSSQFRIDYSLKSVGPSGVRSVNLYITENGGQTWFHYDADPDRRSPIDVSVPHDGVYGFAFRVESGAGLVATPPQPGDAPELTIVVDQVAPTTELLPLQHSGAADQIAIRWVAQDLDLHELPVSLYYSSGPAGPWTLIAGNLANTGRYDWRLPRLDASERLYVRIEVRDQAGNIGRSDAPRPLILDFSQPGVEVLNIEPLLSIGR